MHFFFTSTLCCLCFFLSSLNASDAEALALRRINSCAKETNWNLCHLLADEFLEQYPHSSYKDKVHYMHAEVFLKEKKFDQSLEHYFKIQDPLWVKKVYSQIIYCLDQLKDYSKQETYISKLLNTDASYPSSMLLDLHYHLAESLRKQSPLSLPKFNQAKSIYFQLLHTTYESSSTLSLAELFYAHKNYEKASQYFSKASDLYPNQQLFLKYYEALSLSHYNGKKAAELFLDIADSSSPWASKALYNWMITLFRSSDFEPLLEKKAELFTKLDSINLPEAKLIFAHIWRSKKNYEPILEELKEWITEPKPTFDEAYFLIFDAYKHLKKDTHYKTLFEHPALQNLPSKQKEGYLFQYAQLLEEKEKYLDALNEYEKLIRKPTYQEKALLKKAICLSQLKQYDQAEACLKSNLTLFNEKKEDSLKIRLHNAIEWVKQSPNSSNQELLLLLYEEAFQKEPLFDVLTLNHFKLHTAQLFIEMNQLSKLDSFLETYEMLTSSFSCELSDILFSKLDLYPQLISYIQKCIDSSSSQESKKKIYQKLFSYYSYHQHEVVNAAEALYLSFEIDGHLSSEEMQWLLQTSTSFLETNQHRDEAELEKWATRLERLSYAALKTHMTLSIDPQLTQAIALNTQKKYGETILQLQPILNGNELLSPAQQAFHYELAKAYEHKNELDLAYQHYSHYLHHAGFLKTSKRNYLELKLAHLQLNQSSSWDSETTHQALDKIKKVLLYRSLEDEPLYLEAALDEVLIKAFQDETFIGYLALEQQLNLLKNRLLDQSTLLSQEYHEKRIQNLEQNELFETYIKWIDWLIQYCQTHDKKNDLDLPLEVFTSKILTPYLHYQSQLFKDWLQSKKDLEHEGLLLFRSHGL